MNIIVFFTNAGIPQTGLTPVINGWVVNGTPVISAQAMIEIAGGFYYYDFVGYDESIDYVFSVDGGASLSNHDRYKFGSNELGQVTEDLTDVKGTGFVKNIDSLVNIRPETAKIQSVLDDTEAMDLRLTAIRAGYLDNLAGGPVALEASVAQIPTNPVLATDSRLNNLDALVSSRSTLTAQQVWEYATRTLSSFGTLVADVATAVWGAVTRTLTACVKGTEIDAIKGKTDNLPTDPADQSAVEAAITAATAALALEANVQGHAADALAAYDPPTRAEATTDKQAILDALGALNDITVGELLAGNLADDQVFAAGTMGDRLRKLFWVLCNRMAIVDATGAFIAYKDDGTTPGATGAVEDDGTTTERSIPTWP